jgi:hypothetical protein
MSAAEDLRAALVAHAPLVSLVGARVREDAGDENDTYPYIIFRQTGNEPIRGLDGSLHARVETFQVESWGTTRAQSMQVHALVEEALMEADIECDPADANELDPEIGDFAGVWNARIWTT